MMYIDKNRVQIINERWSQKVAEIFIEMSIAESKSERDTIIDKYHWYWKLFKNQLKEISYNKCWYSETKNPYSHYHVDHFRPKKKVIEKDKTERDGYWWLTFEPSNYRLSGSVGNIKKGNHFAVANNAVTEPGSLEDEVYYLLDPSSREDVSLLGFRQDGIAVESVPEVFGKWEFDRANYTIETLDLNYPDLIESRRIKWMEITFLIGKVEKLINDNNNPPTATKRAKIKSEKDKIRKLLLPCAELTSTTRACLRATGRNWAFRILEEVIDEEQCNN